MTCPRCGQPVEGGLQQCNYCGGRMPRYAAPAGFQYDPGSQMYYRASATRDPATGAPVQDVTWFDPVGGQYTRQMIPQQGVAPAQAGAPQTAAPQAHVAPKSHGSKKKGRTVAVTLLAVVLVAAGVLGVRHFFFGFSNSAEELAFYEQMNAVNESFQQVILDNLSDGAFSEETYAAVFSHARQLEGSGAILNLRADEESGNLLYDYPGGAQSGLFFEVVDPDGEAILMAPGGEIHNLPHAVEACVPGPVLLSIPSGDSQSSPRQENVIGTKNMIILSTFRESDHRYTAAYLALEQQLKGSGHGFNVDTVYRARAHHFQNLQQHGAIFILAHGALYEDQSCIVLEEEMNVDRADREYYGDIQAGRIAVPQYIYLDADGRPIYEGNIAEIANWYTGRYMIKPSFFTHYYGARKLPNSYVHMSICSGMRTISLSNALLQSGAGFVGGYSDIVGVIFDGETIRKIMVLMLNKEGKQTAGSAGSAIASLSGTYKNSRSGINLRGERTTRSYETSYVFVSPDNRADLVLFPEEKEESSEEESSEEEFEESSEESGEEVNLSGGGPDNDFPLVPDWYGQTPSDASKLDQVRHWEALNVFILSQQGYGYEHPVVSATYTWDDYVRVMQHYDMAPLTIAFSQLGKAVSLDDDEKTEVCMGLMMMMRDFEYQIDIPADTDSLMDRKYTNVGYVPLKILRRSNNELFFEAQIKLYNELVEPEGGNYGVGHARGTELATESYLRLISEIPTTKYLEEVNKEIQVTMVYDYKVGWVIENPTQLKDLIDEMNGSSNWITKTYTKHEKITK